MEREYIVTCKTREDLESLYEDLETPGGSLYIPDRAVECIYRRPTSRNTHYSLTDEEATLLKNDDRVLDVELTPEELGIVFRPAYTIDSFDSSIDTTENPQYTETSNRWSKTTNVLDTFRNWGLLRCVNGDTFSGWGSDGTTNPSNGSINYTARVTVSGKNVDVVIVDGCIDPAHPEFAVNSDGSGDSRVNQFNWFSLNSSVTGITGGPYDTYSYRGTPRSYYVTNDGPTNYVFSDLETEAFIGNDPTLNITEGDWITFEVNAPGHPFWVKTANVTGTGSAVTTGIINNGTDGGTIIWNTAGLSPGTYYYICEIHGAMVGTINVTASDYTPGGGQEIDNNHGCHVAGTVAGNRQGWARDANIYNINLYSTAPNVISSSFLFDYVRAWHNSKPVNTVTGKQNPTITNNSWGSFYTFVLDDISSINYRGSTITKPGGGWTQSTLESYGVMGYFIDTADGNTPKVSIPAITSALQADINDCVDDGIIFVGAAGNDYYKTTVSGDDDYNNYVTWFGSNFYYHRGGQPSAMDNVICVGNASSLVNESKYVDSRCGGRIDIYAPGDRIMSSIHTALVSSGSVTSAADSRDANYRCAKYSGTSMAAPQVTGSLACLLEIWPRMTPAEAIDWVKNHGRTLDQMTDDTISNQDYSNQSALQGSPNKYLYHPNPRLIPNPAGSSNYSGGTTTSQITLPRGKHKQRGTSGSVYPRVDVWHRG